MTPTELPPAAPLTPFIEIRVVQAVPLSDEEASVAAVHGWPAPRSGWHYTVALNTPHELVTELTGFAESQPEAERRATVASRELLGTLGALQLHDTRLGRHHDAWLLAAHLFMLALMGVIALWRA